MYKNWQLVAAMVLSVVPAALSGCSRRVDAGPRPDFRRAEELHKAIFAASGTTDADNSSDESSSASSNETAGWATLSGTFKVVGAVSKPAPIAPTKDPEVCGKHKLFDESVEVSSDGGLVNAVIYVRTPKVAVNPEYDLQAGADVVLDNRNCRFEPHVLLLRTSQKLIIKNSDPVSHNSKVDPGINKPSNFMIEPGKSMTSDLESEETSPVKVGCNIHPWMGAWVVVRNNPYAAISDKDGNFIIKDLPAGKDLEFQLWHEPKFLTGAEMAGIKVDGKGRFRLKLEPGEVKKLEIKVPAGAPQ